MRRQALQVLARTKIDDARFLLAHGRSGNAYYLAGYAVELGLKAYIARQIVAEVIPGRRFMSGVYDHDLERLVGVANLADALTSRRSVDDVFNANWGIVTKWSVESRYEDAGTPAAQALVDAVSDAERGVLSWIEAFW
jgi:HEPN domain-containing protein